MDILTVFTAEAPAPGGHYSQAIVHGGLVFVSGQLAIDAATGEKRTGPIEEQTQLVLENLERIVIAAGSDLSRILKTTIYISDIGLWGNVNAVYARFMGDNRPARSVVPTRD
ncbi:MAG: Rid family hydrolase, partial [Acidobacteriota bacterium]